MSYILPDWSGYRDRLEIMSCTLPVLSQVRLSRCVEHVLYASGHNILQLLLYTPAITGKLFQMAFPDVERCWPEHQV
jgi:hypothetical protein